MHTALVMRYYKRGTVAAAMQRPEYMDLDMAQRLRMALQVGRRMSFRVSSGHPILASARNSVHPATNTSALHSSEHALLSS